MSKRVIICSRLLSGTITRSQFLMEDIQNEKISLDNAHFSNGIHPRCLQQHKK